MICNKLILRTTAIGQSPSKDHASLFDSKCCDPRQQSANEMISKKEQSNPTLLLANAVEDGNPHRPSMLNGARDDSFHCVPVMLNYHAKMHIGKEVGYAEIERYSSAMFCAFHACFRLLSYRAWLKRGC
jgi:hypothetical protein